MKFRIVFWDVLPCKIIVDRRFRGTSARTFETSVDNYFIRQYISEDNCEIALVCLLYFPKEKCRLTKS
jgi:hypothetical protein